VYGGAVGPFRHGSHRPPSQDGDAGEVAAAASARQQHPSSVAQLLSAVCVGRAQHASTCGAVDAYDVAGSMDGWRRRVRLHAGAARSCGHVRMPADALC